MISTILAIISELLMAIPIVAKYFPPKSDESKVQDAQKSNADEISKIKDSGRP